MLHNHFFAYVCFCLYLNKEHCVYAWYLTKPHLNGFPLSLFNEKINVVRHVSYLNCQGWETWVSFPGQWSAIERRRKLSWWMQGAFTPAVLALDLTKLWYCQLFISCGFRLVPVPVPSTWHGTLFSDAFYWLCLEKVPPEGTEPPLPHWISHPCDWQLVALLGQWWTHSGRNPDQWSVPSGSPLTLALHIWAVFSESSSLLSQKKTLLLFSEVIYSSGFIQWASLPCND